LANLAIEGSPTKQGAMSDSKSQGYFVDPTRDPSLPPPKEVSGIGGWLCLPLLHLVMSPVLAIWDLVSGAQEGIAESGETSGQALLQFLTLLMLEPMTVIYGLATSLAAEPLQVLSALAWLLLLFGPIIGVAVLAPIVLLILMFQHSERFPRLMIGWYLANAVLFGLTIAILGVEAGSSGSRELVRSITACCIWIPYFLISRRVRNTFVKPID
jgi:Protein of unknown function (DUF2569)